MTILRKTVVTAFAASLSLLGTLPGATAGAQAVPAQKAPNASWAVQPGGDHAASARSSFNYTLKPGSILRDRVRIANTGTRAVKLDLYAADAYLTGPHGAFAVRNKDQRKIDVARWVTFGKRTKFKIRAGRAIDVPFLVRVPSNARPGDHVGAILAASVRADKSGSSSLEFGVRRRVGTRIYLRVPGKLSPRVSVGEIKATGRPALFPYVKGNGSTTVSYQITNDGNTLLTPDAKLELRGPFGNLVETIPVEVPELLPGSSVTQEATFDTLPPLGRLKAELVVTSDDVSTSKSAAVWSVPWAPGLVLLGLGLAWWSRRHLRRRRVGTAAPAA